MKVSSYYLIATIATASIFNPSKHRIQDYKEKKTYCSGKKLDIVRYNNSLFECSTKTKEKPIAAGGIVSPFWHPIQKEELQTKGFIEGKAMTALRNAEHKVGSINITEPAKSRWRSLKHMLTFGHYGN